MTQSTLNQLESSWRSYFKAASFAAFIQVAIVVIIYPVMTYLGPRPETAEAYFELFSEHQLLGIIQADFTSLVLITLYLFTFLGLYKALKSVNEAYTTLAVLLTFVAVCIALATESSFSMLHLSELHENVSDPEKSQLIGAGQGVIASDMWHSSAGFMAGILMQGSGVLISFIMLKSVHFRNITAISGILGNGLDFIQHLLHHLFGMESLAETLLMIGGLFYLIWFLFLGLDFYRLIKP